MERILRISTLLVIIAFIMMIFSCVPNEYKNQNSLTSSDKINEAFAEKIKQGGTLKDIMPPTIIIIFGILIPLFGVIGFFIVFYIYLKLKHLRIMAMIEKGVYEPAKPKIKLKLVFFFSGLIVSFVGIGISLNMIAYYGIHGWSIFCGIIPFFVGISFLIFSIFYDKFNKEN